MTSADEIALNYRQRHVGEYMQEGDLRWDFADRYVPLESWDFGKAVTDEVRKVYCKISASSSDNDSENEPEALRIEEGGFYRARNGEKVGPMTRLGEGSEQWGGYDPSAGYHRTYFSDGKWMQGCNKYPQDLIAPWPVAKEAN